MDSNKYRKYIYDKVLDSNARIILPEVYDKRVIEASKKMKKLGFNLIDLKDFSDNIQLYKENILSKDFVANWTEEMLVDYLEKPFIQGLLMLDNNDSDCLVAGATVSTAEVIRSSIRIIGIDNDWISSTFLMIDSKKDKAYTYADCGVIPEPNEKQLVSIAYNAAKSHKLLTNEDPKVSFLSFSTKGSAEHYKVKRMQDAANIFSNKYPDIISDGEMQFDAAINSDVAKSKNAFSVLKGQANVFIFPDLGSANIAYKITQYLARYEAWGPLLNGLNKPVHDLSRGSSVEDIMNISAIAAFESLS